jgi:nucleotide-binding universal stress UspA family protein
MLRIERILCPVDFSVFSARAYDYAQSLARHYQARLFLQHVVEINLPVYAYYVPANYIVELQQQLRKDAMLQLQEFAQRPADYGAPPERILNEGAPANTILSFAGAQKADLIVMGSHGLQGVDRIALGSVTEKVLRKAYCSVLVVRNPAHDFVSPGSAQDPIQLHKLLVCMDFSEYSKTALEHALSLAAEYHAELSVLHVLEDMPASKDLQGVTQPLLARLEQAIPMEARGQCSIKPLVRIGKPYLEIIQQAAEAKTDAVIMGVRGRNTLDLAVFGSTTHRVIQLGTCPVLAVHV